MKHLTEIEVNVEFAYPWVGWWERNLTAAVSLDLHREDGAVGVELDAVYDESKGLAALTPAQLVQVGQEVEEQVDIDFQEHLNDAHEAAYEDYMEAKYEDRRCG